VYVIRPGVIKSMGKAIAQAGHAALTLADKMAVTHHTELQRWRTHGMAGEVRLADAQTWERLKAELESVVIRDAGYKISRASSENSHGSPDRK
jgi:peptidyl-tRNA hydrolase